MAGFFKQLFNKVTNRADVDWDELEADLIGADLGARTAMSLSMSFKQKGAKYPAMTSSKSANSILENSHP